MADPLRPRTAIDRGPPREEPIQLDEQRPEILPEAGGDSSASDMDANIGGASATAGLDSGGAVGVKRGLSVGRPGFEYDTAPDGEVGTDIIEPGEFTSEEEDEAEWDLATLSNEEGSPNQR